jgi:hypothetical protein
MNIYQPRAYSANMMMKQQAMDEGGGPSTPAIDFKKLKYQFEVNTVFALK